MMRKSSCIKIVVFLILVSMFLLACGTEDEIPPTLAEPLIIGDNAETQPPPEPLAATPEQPVIFEDIYQNANPSGQVITFWHPYTGERETALLEIVEEFNRSNEWNITVAAEYQGSQDDIFDKMLTFMNTAEVPDLVVAYPHQEATYHLGRALIDLNPLVYSSKWGLSREEIEDFVPGLFYQDLFPNFGDIRLGFPTHGSMEVLYYNADWLRELGVEAPPTTPEEFRAVACAAAKQPYSGATAEGSVGYSMNIDATLFASWTFAFGGQIFDSESNQLSYDNPEAVAAMQFIQNLFGEGCASQITERNGDMVEFSQGTALFTLGSSNDLLFYQNGVAAGSNHNWSVAPVPHMTAEPAQNIYGASVAIAKTSPEAQLAAWLFLKFFTSPEVQAKWALASGFFPVRTSAVAGLGDYFATHPAYAAAFKMMSPGVTEPPAAGYDEVQDMVTESMYAISLGADVASTLASLNADANAYLEQQLAVVPETPDSWAEINPSGQTVTFWHQQVPARQAVLDEIIARFNSTNEWGITIVPEYQGTADELFEKTLASFESGSNPGLIEAYQDQAATYYLSGALSDLTELVDSIKWGLSPEEKADFYPGVFSQDLYPNFENVRLGFPLHRSMQVLYYNIDWLAELKTSGAIDFDGPPTTSEQFQLAACAAADNPFSEATDRGSRGYELNTDAVTFATWTFAFGGDVYDHQLASYSYNHPSAGMAADFLQDLVEHDCADQVRRRFEDQANFGTGTTLFVIGSSAGLPFYQEAISEGAKFNMGVAAIPHTTPESVMNLSGVSFSLPENTSPEAKLAAWLFIKYFSSPEIQAQWAQATGYFPVRSAATTYLTDYLSANPDYATVYALLPLGISEPSTPGYDAVRKIVAEALDVILDGERVQPILDQLNEDANLNLTEQLAR